MKLAFLYHPVKDLKESLTFYREVLGWEEAWREGEHTVGLRLPGSDVQLMIEDDELDLGPGGIFTVDSTQRFHEENKDRLEVIKEPYPIPPGMYALYRDPSGNVIRVIDLTNEE